PAAGRPPPCPARASGAAWRRRNHAPPAARSARRPNCPGRAGARRPARWPCRSGRRRAAQSEHAGRVVVVSWPWVSDNSIVTAPGGVGSRLACCPGRPHLQAVPPFCGVVVMSKIEVYSTAVCPYCVAAKNLLKARGLEWTEVRVDTDPSQREAMLTRSGGARTVPQIFINDHHVGGFDDLAAADRSGKLAQLLEAGA